MKRKMIILLISVILLSAVCYYISLPDYIVVNSMSFNSENIRETEIKVVIYKYHNIDDTIKAIEQEHNRINGTPTSLEMEEYHIRLAGCSLYPQGYPAVVSRLKDFRGTNLLADIGNGTMNILYINNKKAVESRCWTEKFGVSQCMTAARNAVMDTFGVRIEEATIEQVFRHGTADIGKPYLDCITSAARQYVADIFATLRRYEYNPDLMRLYIVGGGGCLIRTFGRYEESRVTIIDDICATAKGYEALALAALRRKERP